MTSTTHNFVKSLFADAAPRYDIVVRAGTLGMDVLWKRRLFQFVPSDRPYERILDLACGTGIVTFDLAKRFPTADIIGIDVSPEMLTIARNRNTFSNVRFLEKPAESIGCFGENSFDLIIASYLPKYTDLTRLAINTKHVLSDTGVAVYHDFTYPRTQPLPTLFEIYWAGLKHLLIVIPGYRQIAMELRDLIVDAKDWPDALHTALSAATFDRIHITWQPLEVAAIVTAYNEIN